MVLGFRRTKTNTKKNAIVDGIVDLHSHILPGIDDGATDFEASLELVRELVAGGVSEVFATPHYVDETIYTSNRAANLKLLEELQNKVDELGLKVRIHLGNEIYICPKILEYLRGGEISPMGDSNYLLVELPMSGDFPGYQDIILQLIRSGYRVILAHPERYAAMQNDFTLVSELAEMGVLLQCNLGSLLGQYGKSAMKLAEKLAKEKMIWGMGSDIHHPRGASFMSDAVKKISRYYTDAELSEILVGNPGKIV